MARNPKFQQLAVPGDRPDIGNALRLRRGDSQDVACPDTVMLLLSNGLCDLAVGQEVLSKVANFGLGCRSVRENFRREAPAYRRGSVCFEPTYGNFVGFGKVQ